MTSHHQTPAAGNSREQKQYGNAFWQRKLHGELLQVLSRSCQIPFVRIDELL
jgi:hypothetical protein